MRVRNREAFSLEDMLDNHEGQYSFLFDNSLNLAEDVAEDVYLTPDHGIESYHENKEYQLTNSHQLISE